MEFNLTGIFDSSESTTEIPVRVLILGLWTSGSYSRLICSTCRLEPVILSGMELGGQVSLTYTVENYPGFPERCRGNEMVEALSKTGRKIRAKIEFDTAVEVDLSKRPFRVRTYNATYLAETLIVTTGGNSRHLDVPGEKRLTGRGVSYCATCDGWFFKEKHVFVIGGGDSAVEEGLFLTRYAKSVTLIHRRDSLRAGQILQNRANANPKMKFIWNSVVSEIIGNDSVEAIRLRDTVTGEDRVQPINESLSSSGTPQIHSSFKTNSNLMKWVI